MKRKIGNQRSQLNRSFREFKNCLKMNPTLTVLLNMSHAPCIGNQFFGSFQMLELTSSWFAWILGTTKKSTTRKWENSQKPWRRRTDSLENLKIKSHIFPLYCPFDLWNFDFRLNLYFSIFWGFEFNLTLERGKLWNLNYRDWLSVSFIHILNLTFNLRSECFLSSVRYSKIELKEKIVKEEKRERTKELSISFSWCLFSSPMSRLRRIEKVLLYLSLPLARDKGEARDSKAWWKI